MRCPVSVDNWTPPLYNMPGTMSPGHVGKLEPHDAHAAFCEGFGKPGHEGRVDVGTGAVRQGNHPCRIGRFVVNETHISQLVIKTGSAVVTRRRRSCRNDHR